MNIPEKIKELKSINESHRKLNGELRERIKELEAERDKLTDIVICQSGIIKTQDEINKLCDGITITCHAIESKLQKIIGGK